jgi:hypothetical protein
MSIEAMISEHPQVGGDDNKSLGLAVRRAMLCSAICNSCADACIAEMKGASAMDMSQCIRLCLDCSDVCHATARVAMRRTGHDRQLIRTLLAVCIEACERCGEECARHDNPHCRRCAQMCRECADDCRAALENLNREVNASV